MGDTTNWNRWIRLLSDSYQKVASYFSVGADRENTSLQTTWGRFWCISLWGLAYSPWPRMWATPKLLYLLSPPLGPALSSHFVGVTDKLTSSSAFIMTLSKAGPSLWKRSIHVSPSQHGVISQLFLWLFNEAILPIRRPHSLALLPHTTDETLASQLCCFSYPVKFLFLIFTEL